MKTRRTHAPISILCCYLVALSPMWAMHGCSSGVDPDADTGTGGSSGSDEVVVESFVQMNLDPIDPEVAIVTGKVIGDSLVFFGDKDATGGVTTFTSLAYFAQAGDEEPKFSMLLDTTGRPTFLTNPSTGENARFDYDEPNNVVVISYTGPNGEREIQTFDLDQDSAEAKAILDTTPSTRAPARIPFEDTAQLTTELIQVSVKIQTVPADDPGDTSRVIDTVTDGEVFARTTNFVSSIPPAAYNRATGNYEFVVVSRVTDVNFLVNDCLAKINTVSDGAVAVSVGLGVLGLACTAGTGGLCAFIIGTYGALLGIGVTIGTDQLLKSQNLTCQDLRRLATIGGTGIVRLNVFASVSRLTFNAVQPLEYNLLDPADPVAQTKQASLSFNVPILDCGSCLDFQFCDSGFCRECATTADCADGTFCDLNGECAQCVTSDNCKISLDGPICSNGGCEPCTSDFQCVSAGLGLACNASRCSECVTDQNCVAAGTGFACDVLNRCVECQTTDHCINNQLGADCINSQCVECSFNFNCAIGQTCDQITYQCVGDAVECTTADACLAAQTGQACVNNQCVECSFDSHCASGETCNQTTYECDGPTAGPTGTITITGFSNTDCDFFNMENTPTACGSGDLIDPSLAQIQLSGSATRPTITWLASLNVASLSLNNFFLTQYALFGVTDPDNPQGLPAPFAFNSVQYGDYNLPNIEPTNGLGQFFNASDAVDLVPGTSYTVGIGIFGGALPATATITFTVNP